MAELTPENADELREAILWAVREAAPLELIGGGSKRAIGRPVAASHQLRLHKLSGIRLYEPEELVLTAAAATPLAEIEAALAERGQCLAFEPPDLSALLGTEATATLGGVVVANFAGPRRIAAGAARDHLLGFSGVNGRGEPFKSGGRVVKNVTGYDLSKLVAGSWGTLAALAELSVKVLPRAEIAATIVIEDESAGAAVATMGKALAGPHEVSGAAWLPGSLAASAGLPAGVAATLLRIEGPAPSVAFRAAALGGTRRLDATETESVWRAIRDVRPFVGERDRVVWKVSLPPASGEGLLTALSDADAFLDWGGGLAWLALPPAPDAHAARIRAALAPLGGHATLIRADAQIRAEVPVFQPLPAAHAALSARVKDAFDPRRVLNPGRIYADV